MTQEQVSDWNEISIEKWAAQLTDGYFNTKILSASLVGRFIHMFACLGFLRQDLHW